MAALASPLSLLSKAVPSAESQGAAAGAGGESGEISGDVFAAMLAQQMGAAAPVDLPLEVLVTPAGALELAAEAARAEPLPDPAAAMLQLPMLLPNVVPTATPVSAALEEMPATGVAEVAVPGMEEARQAATNAMASTREEPAENGNSRRQALAGESAAFAVSAGNARALEGDGRVSRAVEARFEPSLVAQAANEMPASATPAAVGMPMPRSVADAPPVQASNAIAQPVTSDVWGDKLGERVVWMVGQQHQGVELHLNPPSLGPLEIKLSMSDSTASLTFSTQHPPVRDAIENATARLREMLAESGLTLGSVSVNVGNFTQQQPGNQALADGRIQVPAWSSGGAAEQSLLPSMVTPVRHNGMVDIFA